MKITIIGFGTWGIALAHLLRINDHAVTAWDSSAAYVNELKKTRRNSFRPNIPIPDVEITSDIAEAAKGAEMFVLALPTKTIDETMPLFAPYIADSGLVVNGSKGFNTMRQMRVSEYLKELLGCRVAVLTGPCHAEEVFQNIPTAVVAAAENEKTAEDVQAVFSSENFRIYTSSDMIGAEMGGALKNVIAIAAGCSDGLGFGDNTKAALITRGIAEITRLGVAYGAKEQTFAGLSGIGDLIVTCTSQHSRNWRAGSLLASGHSLESALAEIGMAVEGVDTAKVALQLAQAQGIEIPIVEEINNVLFSGKSPKNAVVDLMQRERKGEAD